MTVSLKMSQFPHYTGGTPNNLLFPVVDTSTYLNNSINYSDLVNDLNRLNINPGFERHENDIFKISGVENLYSDTKDLLWKITSFSNKNLELFLKTKQLRKATKEEIKRYKLENKVNKYNL